MSVVELVAAGVAERQRGEISRWQKAQEMLELQVYLKSLGRPHSTRDLAALTQMARSKITEQLIIAAELSEESLKRFGLAAEDVEHLPHLELIRLAKLPPYLRSAPLRQIAAQAGREPSAAAAVTTPSGARVRSVREERRAAAYHRMRDEGSFQVTVTQPVNTLTRKEAFDYLDDVIPAFASLAEVVIERGRSYYIGLTGHGGILVYLAPGPPPTPGRSPDPA